MGTTPASQLEQFAVDYRDLTVHRAAVTLDERQDGEHVTRVTLLLDEPTDDTWGVDRVRELRHALGAKATELGLPAVSLTLIPESEAGLIDAFAR